MRHWLATLFVFLTALNVQAQMEEDFASRFMALHAEKHALECITVSPLMMERMLKLPSVEEDGQTKKVLSQLKSIRMVVNKTAADATECYNKAAELAKRNPQRYKLYAHNGQRMLYMRRHGGHVVEIVLFMQREQFCLINLTGNMTDKFLEQVLNI